MKKSLVSLLLVVVLLIVAAMPAFAGGGQVRGEKAQGPATQVQVGNPPPFQP
jgi:hypothetical protein